MDNNNWEALFSELYDKIEPLGGSINHQIGTNFLDYYPIVDLWIELKTKGYKYKNPELNQIEESDEFYMEIDLRRGDQESFIDKSILDLQNQTYNLPYNELIGVHSNEISFSIPQCKFGRIQEGLIEFEVHYILDSHFGILTQQLNKKKNEIQSGLLKTKLKVSDLRIVVRKGRSLNSILSSIKENYDVAKCYLDEEINYEIKDYEVFKVPIKR